MNNLKKGAVFMLISALTFSAMQLVIAQTADTIPLFEQLFFRNIIATLIAFFYIRKEKVKLLGKKENRKLLIMRSLMGFLGMVTMFYASANASQGDVATITKMSPFVTISLSLIIFKERLNKKQIIALVLALLGVVLITGSKLTTDIFPLVVAAASAIFGGIAYTFISMLKGKEEPWVIIFFFSGFSSLLAVPMMLPDFVIPNLSDLLLLILIGIFAAGGQIFLTKAYTVAKASEVSIYNYSGIVFSLILGFIFLGQPIGFFSVIGALCVFAGGILMSK